jgi:succinate dehydrogenase flavin-adding protein (antitoxin of CptAB toxin-antitoxin module)
MSDAAEHDHTIDTGKGTFELSELGHLMPGMAEIMPLVGARIWKCYYAGQARNQALARFQLKEARGLMEKGAFLRPKYTENMDKFIDEEVAAVAKCIESEDWDSFDTAFHAMVEAANAYHDVYDKSFLKWKIPDQPPPDLDMTPRR